MSKLDWHMLIENVFILIIISPIVITIGSGIYAIAYWLFT